MFVFFFLILFRACFQIAQGSTLGVREFLHEFLNGWTLGDDRQYHAVTQQPKSSFQKHFVLGIDEYLEVVEVYAVTLLATVVQDVHLAIAWGKSTGK
jgi:hypothetical protein